MSEFRNDLVSAFRGRRVYVVSNTKREFEGWVQSIQKHDRHVLLRDATDLTEGRDVGARGLPEGVLEARRGER